MGHVELHSAGLCTQTLTRATAGQSAGGGSVVSQLIADGGKTTPQLFRRAILSSPLWPRHYRYDSAEAEELFDRLAELEGCSGDGDPLECLKQAPVQRILDANVAINTLRANTTSSYAWAPVIDAFLPQSLTEAARRGAALSTATPCWPSTTPTREPRSSQAPSRPRTRRASGSKDFCRASTRRRCCESSAGIRRRPA